MWAFPAGRVDGLFVFLTLSTVVFATFSQIQLPRVKVHITLSDILVFLVLILYGGELATLVAVMESVTASLSFKRRGINITAKTVALNGAIAAVSTYTTAYLAQFVLGPPYLIAKAGQFTELALMLSLLALALFAVNSIFVTIFTSLKTGRSLWEVWYVYCLNGLVLYLTSAFFAGLLAKTLYSFDSLLVTLGLAAAGLVYFTFWRYVNDIKKTSAQAEQVERERAEQAERHIVELEHYVEQKEIAEVALRESREEFRHAAYHDALTDLPNRNFFRQRLNELLAECGEDLERSFAVLFLDLDRFKRINDSLGHSLGDRFLKEIANRLTALEHEGKLVARFGGDEFGVILEKAGGVDTATEVAKEIVRSVSRPVRIGEKKIQTGVSVGIVIGDATYSDGEDLIRDSDIAMYHAKESSRPFELFDKRMHETAVNLIEIETGVRHAIERNELTVNYQPIVSLSSLEIRGFEALVRWTHPTRGPISPAEFIPVCESTGLIVPLTQWILRESCSRLSEWSLGPLSDSLPFISVNLSGRHFAEPDLLDHVNEVIYDTRIRPSQLKLEITESAAMENADAAIKILQQLRAHGIQVSIDDFGTGYSSLSYLQRFPINTLKIDRSFVTELSDETGGGKLVSTIVAMAKALDLDVIAEGIETETQAEKLRDLGCEFGQGYLFSKPLTEEGVLELLDGWRTREDLLRVPVVSELPGEVKA